MHQAMTFNYGSAKVCLAALFETCFPYDKDILMLQLIIVSTGSIRWILWFSVRYTAAARREIFGVNALGGKRQQLGSPNLQDIFIGG